MSTADSQIMNYVVRMVVPMRREFGRSLNVVQFLHDLTYAREVIDEALTSRDARLREYADYVQQRLHGPRISESPTATKASDVVAADTTQQAAAVESVSATEAQLKARMLKKYTSGLR
jgi:hypothetical protein